MVFKSYRTTCLHQQKTSNLLPHAKCLNLQVQEIAENLDISITFEEKNMKKKLPLPLGSKSRLEPMPPMPACRYFHSPEEEAPENRADLATCCVKMWSVDVSGYPFGTATGLSRPADFHPFSSVRIHVRWTAQKFYRGTVLHTTATPLRSSSRQRDLKPYFFLS